ncbi:PREDICTED: spindle and kinetochore-associated protein 1 homolog isoform X2 [Tarenaya hassleriana]|uniref:spindle and kinetochore-associated protein 1 homolog isoform X2 n=1 Tax=Tarenaya hassleriana TaxID=28532 RepID=UPI00053C85BF|nr:PREDICTED: spindle and kinetochore-associated protein 1 homolog isoform X2 [Tarenaya hassleriana]
MEAKEAGSSLDSLISTFNNRISELQELVIARNMYPASSIPDLSAIDTALKAMELQVQSIKDRLREETDAIPKAKKLIEASLQQQKKLQKMSVYALSHLPDRTTMLNSDVNRSLLQENAMRQERSSGFNSLKVQEEAVVLPKEKKGRGSPPLWFITAEELGSLSSYMRGRLTLEKVNAAISDMASYAEANAQLIVAPKKKLAENLWERALVSYTSLVKLLRNSAISEQQKQLRGNSSSLNLT